MFLRSDVLDGVRLAAVLDDRQSLVALYARPEDDRPWLGDIYAAQVTRYAAAQRAYFLDIGMGQQAFLPHKDEGFLQPGQFITVMVERPKTRDKHIRCSLVDGAASSVGRVQHGPDLAAQALADYPMAQGVNQGLEDFDSAILDLLEPRVVVQNGIEMVIESVTALTAIDINNADPELSPLEVNRLVTKPLAQQLKLRNIGGQVLVDFLRLRDPKHRTALQNAIQQAVTLDPCPVQLYGFTRLGLFEMTRTKRGLPLAEIFALVK